MPSKELVNLLCSSYEKIPIQTQWALPVFILIILILVFFIIWKFCNWIWKERMQSDEVAATQYKNLYSDLKKEQKDLSDKYEEISSQQIAANKISKELLTKKTVIEEIIFRYKGVVLLYHLNTLAHDMLNIYLINNIDTIDPDATKGWDLYQKLQATNSELFPLIQTIQKFAWPKPFNSITIPKELLNYDFKGIHTKIASIIDLMQSPLDRFYKKIRTK